MTLNQYANLIRSEIEGYDVSTLNFDQSKLTLLKKQCSLGPFEYDYQSKLEQLCEASWIKIVPNHVVYYITSPDMRQHRVILNTITTNSIKHTIENIFSQRKTNEIVFLHNISIIDGPSSYIKQITFSKIEEKQEIAAYW